MENGSEEEYSSETDLSNSPEAGTQRKNDSKSTLAPVFVASKPADGLFYEGEDLAIGKEGGGEGVESVDSEVGGSAQSSSGGKSKKSGAKPSRKRKSQSVEEGDGGAGTSATGAKAKKKSRKDQAVEDFMLLQLPSLRKELKLRKKNQAAFQIRDPAYQKYFSPNSKFTPTFILPLFQFLGKNEIVCTRYGKFNGGSRHLVKTDNGFTHVSLLMANCDFAPEEAEYLMKKFGTEWFKIPAKDESKVSAAQAFGTKGHFKVVLTGLYEDSFLDKEGNKVQTVNPILRYEPIRVNESSSNSSKTD